MSLNGPQSGFLLVLDFLRNREAFGEIGIQLHLARVDAEVFRLEEDALGDDVELGEVHCLNLELLRPEELEVRVLGPCLDVGHLLFGLLPRHELGVWCRRLLALGLGLLACVGVFPVFGDDLLELLHALAVGLLEPVREDCPDFYVQGEVADLEFALLRDEVPVENSHSLDFVGTGNRVHRLDSFDVC